MSTQKPRQPARKRATGETRRRYEPSQPSREETPAHEAQNDHPGELVRVLRQRRGMTLDALALDAGLSKGHLSRFERGEKTVSLAALLRIAQALGTSAASLLGEQVDRGMVHVVRAGERHYRKQSGADYRYAALSRASGEAGSDADGPTALVLRLPADAHVSEAAFHKGDEIFFVLSGAIEIELGDQSILLREGDFAEFPGHVKHRIRSVGTDAEVLIVVTGSGR
ncbi:helix-turn-helix domain-containing protein [Pandoraea vervacti]|nr:XRE family transcriptional regulator [Pandoraea vervacti]